jgi:archaellum component FlaC
VNGVKDDKNNYQSINYNGMIGILTNEIKMLKNKLEELTNKINTMM